jgi:hypothetical protein
MMATLFLATMLSIAGQTTLAQDRITTAPPTTKEAFIPRSFRVRSGTIVDFNAEQLQLKVGDETYRIDSQRVVRVEFQPSNERIREGFELFQSRQYDKVIATLQHATKQAPPVWQQQLIGTRMIAAAMPQKKYAGALELTRNLVDSKAPPMAYRFFPIDWTGLSPDPKRTALAVETLGDPRPILRVIAASWLLAGTERDDAAEALRGVAKGSDEDPIATILAKALLWRTTPVPEIESRSSRWLEAIDQEIPIAVQAGPIACVADRLSSASRTEQALVLWLELALEHDDLGPLHEEAVQRAREALGKLGRGDEADRLLP